MRKYTTSKTRNGIRSRDIPIIDKVFGMEHGNVLNFSIRTLAHFFMDEFGVDIDDPSWSAEGESKGKRLRYYLRQADQETALKTLNALWEYREVSSVTHQYPELEEAVLAAFFKIIERLQGERPVRAAAVNECVEAQVDAAIASTLTDRLVELSSMDPQSRGYAFERFLKDLFNAYGLLARSSYRPEGEQIDGSLVLGNSTYLLEAKWTNTQVDAATLRAFNAKVEDKAKWTRGLFVSYSGFTPGGLVAFGRGKSVICMNGLDLHEILARRLDFSTVLTAKVRLAAETGKPYVGVRDLTLAPSA